MLEHHWPRRREGGGRGREKEGEGGTEREKEKGRLDNKTPQNQLTINFIFPVPEASVPAVEICSDKSEAGITTITLINDAHTPKYITDTFLSI